MKVRLAWHREEVVDSETGNNILIYKTLPSADDTWLVDSPYGNMTSFEWDDKSLNKTVILLNYCMLRDDLI